GDRVQNGYLFFHQMKNPLLGLGCIQFNSWPKGSNRNPQTTHAVAKKIGYSLSTDSKAPLLMTTPTQLI
ncbi:hypothetical protein ACQP3D_29690, partial [Escherichia coli]